MIAYPIRPAETIAGLIRADAPGNVVDRWVDVAARRRFVAIAGIDAHEKLALRGDPGGNGFSLPLPGYESSFRVLSVRATPDPPLSGEARVDAHTLVRAIRNGHLYVAVDAVATPASFDFSATNERGTVHEGDEIAAGGPVTLRVRSNAPPSFTTTVWAGNRVLSGDHHEQDFTVAAPPDPAVYWVEIRSTGRADPIAWVRSNAIYVRGAEPRSRPPARPPASTSTAIFDGTSLGSWRTEQDVNSVGAVELAGASTAPELRFRFGLAGGSAVGQYAAVVFDITANAAAADRVTFRARAERPMRISVQLRGGEGVVDRWQRSVYLDTFDREHTVFFDDCLPVGTTSTPRAPPSGNRSLLFVVDTTNTKPGTSGRLWIKTAVLQP